MILFPKVGRRYWYLSDFYERSCVLPVTIRKKGTGFWLAAWDLGDSVCEKYDADRRDLFKTEKAANAAAIKADNAKTLYLAGEISADINGYSGKFHAAAAKLRGAGFIVINPALLPPTGFNYRAYLRMSKAMLRECAAICLLPDWGKSNGARREYAFAKRRGLKVYKFDGERAVKL